MAVMRLFTVAVAVAEPVLLVLKGKLLPMQLEEKVVTELHLL
jgi:hypothetical protein